METKNYRNSNNLYKVTYREEKREDFFIIYGKDFSEALHKAQYHIATMSGKQKIKTITEIREAKNA